MSRVAIITGGASGMGLAVATSLSQHPSEKWSVHIFDINDTQGHQVAQSIGATFHQCDVSDYDSLASTFHQIFAREKRLDFVHANAGILGQRGFAPTAAPVPADEPPPPPDMKVMHINLMGVITTSWVAMHYFRLTRKSLGGESSSWEGNLVMTASISALYVTYGAPLYGAAKYGVLGLVRSIAGPAHSDTNVRVNCICPGLVLTGMTARSTHSSSSSSSSSSSPSRITPMEKIIEAVRVFIDGKGIVDSTGFAVADGQVFGRALEVGRNCFRFAEMPPFSDPDFEVLLDRKNSLPPEAK